MGFRRFAGSFPVDTQACDAEQKPAETTSPAGAHRRVLAAGISLFIMYYISKCYQNLIEII